MPNSHLWRRLLAELGLHEQVHHIAVLTDGSRDMCVAVCDKRVLVWHARTERIRRLSRATLQLAEHHATKDGVVRLTDGSTKTPMRLAGELSERRALLAALGLAGGRQRLVPVVLDLSVHPKTKFAYNSAAARPASTGPVADEIFRELGSTKTASFMTIAQLAIAGRPTVPVVVLGASKWLVFVANGGPRPLFQRLEGPDLSCQRVPGGVRLTYEQPVQSELATVMGSEAVVAAVENQVRHWRMLVDRKRQLTAIPSGSGAPLASIPVVRRSFFGRPKPMPVSDWREAEAVACAWMREFGFRDARLTAGGADEGVDVLSKKAVAQVKWKLSAAIGRPDVQRLFGAAQSAKSKPVFFSGSGYTAAARTWAEANGVAAFTLTAHGEIVPITSAARRMAKS